MKFPHNISRIEAFNDALSIVLAKLKIGLVYGLPGIIYGLLGPFCYFHGVHFKRKYS